MWGYFSRGPDFPYTLGEQLQTTENSVWELYKGKKKVKLNPLYVIHTYNYTYLTNLFTTMVGK